MQDIREKGRKEEKETKKKKTKTMNRAELMSSIREAGIAVEKKKKEEEETKVKRKLPSGLKNQIEKKEVKLEHALPPKSRESLLADIRGAKGKVRTKEKQQVQRLVQDIERVGGHTKLKETKTRSRGDMLADIRGFKKEKLQQQRKPRDRQQLMAQIREMAPEHQANKEILKQSPELLEAIRKDITLKKRNYAPRNHSQLMQDIRTQPKKQQQEKRKEPKSRQALMSDIRGHKINRLTTAPAKKPKSRMELMADIRNHNRNMPSRYKTQPANLLVSIREQKYRKQLKHVERADSKKDLHDFLN